VSERKIKVSDVFVTIIALSIVFVAVVALATRETHGRSGNSVAASEKKPSTTITREALDDVFNEAMRSHPRPEISEGLYGKIKDGTIRHSYDIENGAAGASFVVLSGSDVVPSRGANVLIPAIYIQPGILVLARNDTRGFRNLQSVLYHEYQHYLQWEATAAHKALFNFGKKHIIGREDCAALWRYELSAYLAECELAKEQGWEAHHFSLCEAYGEPGRFKATLRQLLQGAMSSLGITECAPIWDEAVQ